MKTVRGNSHGGSNPSACANKNGLLLAGRPIFIATVRGDEPEGFAYRRHRAHHEEQTLRGICVARRCRIEFYTEAERLELTLPRAAYPSSQHICLNYEYVDKYLMLCYNSTSGRVFAFHVFRQKTHVNEM